MRAHKRLQSRAETVFYKSRRRGERLEARGERGVVGEVDIAWCVVRGADNTTLAVDKEARAEEL